MQVAPAIQKEKHRTELSNRTNGQKFTWTKIARLNWAWSFKNLNLFAPRSGFTVILSGCWLICTHGYSLGCHKPTEKLLHAFFSWKQPLNQRQINVRAIRIAFNCCKYHQLPINNRIYSIRNWAQSENTLTETDWETNTQFSKLIDSHIHNVLVLMTRYCEVKFVVELLFWSIAHEHLPIYRQRENYKNNFICER